MTEEEQRRIFVNNLNKYIALNGKPQTEIARDLEIKPTTLNMWCRGNAVPGPGKIRRLADYFGIAMSDLTDEKIYDSVDEEFSDVSMKIALSDERFKKIVIAYSKLPVEKKKLLCDFLEEFVF